LANITQYAAAATVHALLHTINMRTVSASLHIAYFLY